MHRDHASGHTDKQKRQAKHIEQSERNAGKDKSMAEKIAWATVNKRNGERNVDHERERHGDRQ